MIRIFLKLWHCQIIWYIFVGFKTIMLFSVHCIRFMKWVFSVKIWFLKTSTRIMKYKSWVVKSDSACKARTSGEFDSRKDSYLTGLIELPIFKHGKKFSFISKKYNNTWTVHKPSIFIKNKLASVNFRVVSISSRGPYSGQKFL